jgi:predicted ribosomally synthesized peptide with nif11-like leader
MTDNLKKFMHQAASDAGLRGKLGALSAEHRAKFIALAGEYGVTLTEADFADGLDDDELAAVAGGSYMPYKRTCPASVNYYGIF